MPHYLRLVGALVLTLVLVAPARAQLLSEHDLATYRAAFAAAKAGDWDSALREGAKARDHSLETALEWIEITHGGASFPAIAAFIASHPDWPQQRLLRARAESALANAPDETAARWFASHPPVTIAGRLREAQLRLNEGRNADAAAIIREVWINADFSAFDEHAFYRRYHHFLRQKDDEARLDRLVWANESRAARRMLGLVSPDDRALAEARLALANLAPGAEHLLARVPPSLQHDPGLIYDRIRWRQHKGHYDDAIPLLESAPTIAAHADAWAAERGMLARYALAEHKPFVAYRLAARHGPVRGESLAELEFLAGWIALRYLHEPRNAYDHFVDLYKQVKRPISLARGAYWAARAASAMGYDQLAQAWYGTAAEQITTYYGQLAAAQIGAPGASRVIEPHPDHADIVAFDDHPLVRVTRELGEIRASDDAAPFIRYLSRHARTPAEYALVARLATRLHRPDLAVAAAKEASYHGVILLSEGYPIEDVPRGGPIERPMVLAMTRQESAFDLNAVSRAGARGLMQLMPATASHIAHALRMRFSLARLTTDERYNLTLGQDYFATLLDDFHGSYVLAIAAYNAGPARVQEWIDEFGDPRTKDIDAIDWIESIPVSETRNYVQRVLENLQIYRYRLGDHRLAFSLVSDLQR